MTVTEQLLTIIIAIVGIVLLDRINRTLEHIARALEDPYGDATRIEINKALRKED